MTTESKTLRIRRATPLDAVNLYRIQTDEERKANATPLAEEDQSSRLMHILTVIETGYVSVVEISGRIVGSIGFAPGGAPYQKARSLVSEWAFLTASFRNPKIVARLVAGVTRFADKYKAPIIVSLSDELGDEIVRVWEDQGFDLRTRVFARPALEANEPEFDSLTEPDDSIAGDPVHDSGSTPKRDSVALELDDDADDPLYSRPPVQVPEPEPAPKSGKRKAARDS